MTNLAKLVRIMRTNPVMAKKRVIGECVNNLAFNEFFLDDGAVIESDKLVAVLDEVTPFIVKADPYRAGRTAILVNIADVVAMGATPIFALDCVRGDKPTIRAIGKGLARGAYDTGIPIVGGHTTFVKNGEPSVSVAMIGKYQTKPTLSSTAENGDSLIVAIDTDGSRSTINPQAFVAWNKPKEQLWKRWTCIISLAQYGFVHAAKDISMAGTLGTLTMLCEASRLGALLDVDKVPKPINQNIQLQVWLISYMTMGFIFAVAPSKTDFVLSLLNRAGFNARDCGRMYHGSSIRLKQRNEEVEFWDWDKKSIFGYKPRNGGW